MGEVRIDCNLLEKFTFDILCASGIETREAHIIAKVMVWTDMIGRSGHGLARLPIFLKRYKLNLINSPCSANFVKKSDAVFLLEGHNGPGQFLAHEAMAKAIDIADTCGVGIVGVQNSNHFGAGAYYAHLAAEAKKISIVTTNSFPLVVPHGGISPVFGTNPFTFGAPVKDGQSILADFSTGAVSGATFRKAIADRKNILPGSALDEQGNDIVEPEQAGEGNILPIAGAKGYGLGLMIEIISGVLTGSAISHEIGSVWKDFTKSNRVGHLLIALDISNIIPLEIYYERIADLTGFIKAARKMNTIDEILLPGETRWRHYQQNVEKGVPISDADINELNSLADTLGLIPPWQI